MSEAHSLHLDDQGRIDEDLLCRACDYNLRGLSETADCPECSTPVARSARPDLVRFSDPIWLTRLSRGMLLIIIGILAGLVVGTLIGVGAAILPMVGIPYGTVRAVSGTLSAAVSLVTVVGIWLATTPEPGRPEPDGHVTARRIARWCIMIQVVSAPMKLAGMGQGGFGALGSTRLFTVLTIVGMTLGIVVVLGQIAGLIYLRRLALRIPARKLARSTKIVTWGYISCHAAGLATGFVILAMRPSLFAAGSAPAPGLRNSVVTVTVASCGVMLGTLVFGIWAMVLLFRYRTAFQYAAEQSRAAWGP
ncbi:MAG: hypothetical protein V3S08_02375 [Phycisphaerales bacterium]